MCAGMMRWADTLLLRSAPNDTDVPIGAMLFSVGTSGVTQYQIAAPDSLRAGDKVCLVRQGQGAAPGTGEMVTSFGPTD